MARVSFRAQIATLFGVTATAVLVGGLLLEEELHVVVFLGVALPLYAVAVGVAAWVITGIALRPVRHMTREADAITLERRGRRLPQLPGDDALADLARTLNQMIDRIEATVAHERGFVDDASHELRTPLAVLRGELELALLDIDDPEALERNVRSALEEADRLSGLVDSLLVLARSDAGQLGDRTEDVDVLAAARAVVARTSMGRRKTVAVTGTSAVVAADRSLIEQVIANLVRNALRHARSEVLVDVGVGADEVVLLVADDGPGFDREMRRRAFDRFARSDRARGRRAGGTGLGLAIVAAIASAFGGRAEARNGEPLGGARVTVRFPQPASPPYVSRATPTGRAPGGAPFRPRCEAARRRA